MRATAQVPTYVASPAAKVMGWARQGVESFVTVQNILLDLTAQESALAIGVLRERLNLRSLRPRISITTAADKSVATLTSAGKIMVDLAEGENALVTEGLKEGLRLSPRTGAIADLIRARIEAYLEMYKRVLDITAEQTHATLEAYNDGRGLKIRNGLSEMARQSVIGMVETEQKFLDTAAEQVTIALQPPKEVKKPVRDRSKALAHLAYEGIDKVADAEKKLIDLAMSQLITNGNHAERKVEEEAPTPLTEVTRKGFQSLVVAQKALMDVAIKPIRRAAHKPEAAKPVGRPKRRK